MGNQNRATAEAELNRQRATGRTSLLQRVQQSNQLQSGTSRAAFFLRHRMSRPKEQEKMSRPKHFYGRPTVGGLLYRCPVQERPKVRRLDEGGHPERSRYPPLTLGKL